MSSADRPSVVRSNEAPFGESLDVQRAIATFCRATCFGIGCLLLLIAIYYSMQVYAYVAEIVRDPATLKPRIDALADVIHADKLSWQPPEMRLQIPAAAAAAAAEAAIDPPTAAKPPEPIEFGHAVTLLLYCVLISVLVRIPLAFIRSGAWVMSRSFAQIAGRES